MSIFNGDIVTERRGQFGLITLNRSRALNALSLSMVRDLTAALQAWAQDPGVLAVAIRGRHKEGDFGAFCAGGDIRFLHQAGSVGDADLEAFFTEEYALNHLIHRYPKPYIAFMDGIVMGGGMGISQGGSVRIVTERTKMAMPETNIGLFPDVGGGYFLSRCPGHVGEWLALTGDAIGAGEALAYGLADHFLGSDRQAALWEALAEGHWASGQALRDWLGTQFGQAPAAEQGHRAAIDHHFALADATAIVQSLEASADDWARQTGATLRKRSPLMLHVVLEQVRRARSLDLAQDLRMERDMVHRCFHLRPGQSETLEGIRALAVDKDHQPRWNPARVEDVPAALVAQFFDSPWTPQAHPLHGLA
ncbi:MAG: enoyl-CoA hydratase/isomerase family protein [Curvibacter sp.]|nr:enoyl-CoA hydratase/isomerase family protein [Curvibacter sp.]